MSQQLVDILKTQFGPQEAIVETSSFRGDEVVEVKPSQLFAVVKFLKESPSCQMDLLVDLTVVDWPNEEPRFEMVYHFYSIKKKHRLRLKARIGSDDEEPSIASIVPLYSVANWLEREAFDLYGVHFEGHPNLRRILMYEGFEGHPLRKDYPIAGRQPLIGPKN